jgi:hypothetical protein
MVVGFATTCAINLAIQIVILVWMQTNQRSVRIIIATFNNISGIAWRSYLLMQQEAKEREEYPETCRKALIWIYIYQVTDKLYYVNVVSSTLSLSVIRTHNVSGDRH